MDRERILEEIRKAKSKSIAYQRRYGYKELENEIQNNICPSDEFLEKMFKQCAERLGFEYKKNE